MISIWFSLGGDDRIVVWNIFEGHGFNGQLATMGSTGQANAVAFYKNNDNCFVSAGEQNIRFWYIDEEKTNFFPENAKLDQTKRTITSLSVDYRDEFVYCGTTTGDVLKYAIKQQKLVTYGPKKALGQGICSLNVAPWGDIIVGSGCGKVAVLDIKDLHILSSADLNGKVTSVALVESSNAEILCGTSESDIISINTDNFKPRVLSKGHYSGINDLFFPNQSSKMFCTCALGGFHVWNSTSYQELLRVDLPRSECNCIAVPSDGKIIITGWSDGKIRGYSPQFGKELWTVNEAHLNGVTAIAILGSFVVTGGMTGDVCVWNMDTRVHTLVKTLKEHHSKISQIRFNHDGSEFLSTSHDGSVIVWDAKRITSRLRFMSQTFFNGADIHDETGIIITVSSDKRICFYDSFNANLIRELEGSINAQPNSICISPDGKKFVTGGDEKLVKIWDFQSGELLAVGRGHCGSIQKVLFAPDQSIIVSIGGEGGIYIWKPK